jgi:hypothetical protein
MKPLELSDSNAEIWSVTLALSITNLEASFSLIYDVYRTGISYDDHQLTIIMFIAEATGVILRGTCWDFIGYLLGIL